MNYEGNLDQQDVGLLVSWPVTREFGKNPATDDIPILIRVPFDFAFEGNDFELIWVIGFTVRLEEGSRSCFGVIDLDGRLSFKVKVHICLLRRIKKMCRAC